LSEHSDLEKLIQSARELRDRAAAIRWRIQSMTVVRRIEELTDYADSLDAEAADLEAIIAEREAQNRR
jgi:hypothetical protein